MSNKGVFIVLEGADGAGTTTQGQNLVSYLKKHRDLEGEVVWTREPSDGHVGIFIRKLLRIKSEPWDWKEMTRLFIADRFHHVRTEIEPALKEGKIVVCDRYYGSTLVYQSSDLENFEFCTHRMQALFKEMRGRNFSTLDAESMDGFHSLLEPDLWLYLGVNDSSVLEKRRISRDQDLEMYEKTELQSKILLLYDFWYKFIPGNKHYIDAIQSIDKVFKNCCSEVCKFLKISEKE